MYWLRNSSPLGDGIPGIRDPVLRRKIWRRSYDALLRKNAGTIHEQATD
jgi:hypothetical protein